MKNINRRMSRKGVGHVGHVFMYGTHWSEKDGFATKNEYEGRDKKVKRLNKHPTMKRALKKAERREGNRFDNNE